MGSGDDAVTDDQGRVKAIAGLRVVDASIMPKNVTGNLNGPILMLAEKVANRIRGRQPLTPSKADYYRAFGEHQDAEVQHGTGRAPRAQPLTWGPYWATSVPASVAFTEAWYTVGLQPAPFGCRFLSITSALASNTTAAGFAEAGGVAVVGAEPARTVSRAVTTSSDEAE